MTWTPIHRQRDCCGGLKSVMTQWIPYVMANPLVQAERANLNQGILPCFGSRTGWQGRCNCQTATSAGRNPTSSASSTYCECRCSTPPSRKSQRTLESYRVRASTTSNSSQSRLETPLEVPWSCLNGSVNGQAMSGGQYFQKSTSTDLIVS